MLLNGLEKPRCCWRSEKSCPKLGELRVATTTVHSQQSALTITVEAFFSVPEAPTYPFIMMNRLREDD